jgi:hypothetical protein
MTQAPTGLPASSRSQHLAEPVPGARAITWRALLAVAVIVPVAVLFGQMWNAKGATAEAVANERRGIEYLRAITPVTTALVAAESVAVNGETVDFAAIDRAMLQLARTDASNDASPGAHSRFAGLSLKVQQLHTLRATSLQQIYAAYSEVTGLALALTEEVRQESGLIRDQAADAYFLEDGAGHQLPEAVVSAGQYGDLVSIAIGQSATDRQLTIGEIAAARAALLASADTLGNDVRLAVDATASQTLSNDLLAKLDRFRLAIDALVPPASMPNQLPSNNDHSVALADKARVQTSATDLSDAMLTATDGLLRQRVDSLGSGRSLALGTFAFVVLVAIAPLVVTLFVRRRRRRSFHGPGLGSGSGPPTQEARPARADSPPRSGRATSRELSGAAR